MRRLHDNISFILKTERAFAIRRATNFQMMPQPCTKVAQELSKLRVHAYEWRVVVKNAGCQSRPPRSRPAFRLKLRGLGLPGAAFPLIGMKRVCDFANRLAGRSVVSRTASMS